MHGLSSNYYSGTPDQAFQGMIQGNRAASPAWMINTIMLILYLYQLGLVPISRTPILDEIFQLIA